MSVDSIQISMDAGKAAPEPKVPANIEETATGVAVKAEADGTVKAPEKATDPQARPAWLPEKFKTPEEMAAAYKELETKQGTKPAADPAPVPTPTEAADAVKAAGLDMSAINTEYAEKGELSEATLKALEAKGIKRETVAAYIEGQKAVAAQMVDAAAKVVGGEENLKATLGWAKANLSEAAIEAFNSVVDGGNLAAIDLAVRGLFSQFVAANGSEPQLVSGETVPGSAGNIQPFTTTEQVRVAMADPQYKKDPAFRKQVEQRLAVSNVFG